MRWRMGTLRTCCLMSLKDTRRRMPQHRPRQALRHPSRALRHRHQVTHPVQLVRRLQFLRLLRRR